MNEEQAKKAVETTEIPLQDSIAYTLFNKKYTECNENEIQELEIYAGESKANEEFKEGDHPRSSDGKFGSGSGNDKDYTKTEEHPYGEEELFLCGKCKGSGEINGKECSRCGGTGAGGAKESRANEYNPDEDDILAGRSIEEYLKEYDMTIEEGEEVARYADMDLRELIQVGNFGEAKYHMEQDNPANWGESKKVNKRRRRVY